MPDVLTLAQLVPAQPAATARVESRENSGTPAPVTESSGPSFATILKSKRTAGTGDAGRKDLTVKAAEDVAEQPGLVPLVPPGLSLAPQVSAGLDAAQPAAKGVAADAIAEPPVPGIDATALASATLPASQTDGVSTPATAQDPAPVALVPSSVAPSFSASAPVPATMPLRAAAAAALAPTPGPIGNLTPPKAASASPGSNIVAKAPTAELSAGVLAARERPELAAPTAKSAEAALPAGDRSAPEPVIEFRSLVEPMSTQAGNIGMPASPVQTAAPQAGAEPTQLRLATPFAQTGWTREVEQKLSWIVTQTHQQADLVLNPPQLGRVEVTLTVQGDQVNLSLASPHPAVREALDESLVRLRETLADAGINLGQTHVGHESSRDAPFLTAGGDARRASGQTREVIAGLTAPQTAGAAWLPLRTRGMVDVFA